MSWIPGLWMGIFWIGLGLFILVSTWIGKSSFYIPRLGLNMGWVVVALGLARIWWWWKTEELPARKKREVRSELRQMELEMEMEEAEHKENNPSPENETT